MRSCAAHLEAVDVGQVHVQHHGGDTVCDASTSASPPVPASRVRKPAARITRVVA
jgi:hypothetical protein